MCMLAFPFINRTTPKQTPADLTPVKLISLSKSNSMFNMFKMKTLLWIESVKIKCAYCVFRYDLDTLGKYGGNCILPNPLSTHTLTHRTSLLDSEAVRPGKSHCTQCMLRVTGRCPSSSRCPAQRTPRSMPVSMFSAVHHLAGHWEPLYYQKRVMLAYKEQR